MTFAAQTKQYSKNQRNTEEMSFSKDWIKGRESTRYLKEKSMRGLLIKMKGKSCYTKLEDLVKLYMDSHDLVTQIGFEITKIADDN